MSSRPASRLFVDAVLESGTELTLPEGQSHYVHRVLRLKTGDALTLFDGRGGEFAATLLRLTKQGVVARVGAHTVRDCESPLSMHLIQAVSRSERMDFVVQKATELGVRRITPVMTEFSLVRLDAKKRDSRVLHWTRIAQSACEQCGRNTVPLIETPRPFDECLQENVAHERLRIVLRPQATRSLATLDPPRSGIDLMVGPEGGFSEREFAAAETAGFVACAFGPRTLRTETAAIAAIAVLQARWGDLL